MLGQEVAKLMDGFKPAGSYSVVWNAENLASGMYIYRLQSGNEMISHKMLLLSHYSIYKSPLMRGFFFFSNPSSIT